MIKYFVLLGFMAANVIHPAEAADWKVIPRPRSAMVSATANQNFSAGPGKTEKSVLPDFASLPQALQASSSDQAGPDRSAQGEARLEMENGVVRFKGKLETTDSAPNDFLAPIASIKGMAAIDLKVLLSNPSGTIKGSVRVSHEASPLLAPSREGGGVGEGDGERKRKENELPETITVKVFVNDELVINSTDFSLGVEKEIPVPLHHDDSVTLLIQEEFNMIASGKGELVSTVQYTFKP
ncbi:MAG: hypothetical protein EPO39_09645 [Candidatus Manganitrophaceae bacterium]|nr:MAG: hypothetical protein EPO39_09645 [Candidatus Manganitrophaceae bacterium]